MQAARIPGISDQQTESWRGGKRAALISLAISLLLLLGVFTARADAQLLSGYCSPTGDYCHSVNRSQKGIITLNINTFSFTGKYNLCVRLVSNNNRQCRPFKLSTGSDVHVSRVNFRRAFLPAGRGRWCATWRKDGFKLGPANCFTYTGKIVHPG